MNRPQTLGYDGSYPVDKIKVGNNDLVVLVDHNKLQTVYSKNIIKTFHKSSDVPGQNKTIYYLRENERDKRRFT